MVYSNVPDGVTVINDEGKDIKEGEKDNTDDKSTMKSIPLFYRNSPDKNLIVG